MKTIGTDLFAEKDLFSIYWQCVTKLPISKFNLWAMIIFFSIFSIEIFFFWENFSGRLEAIRSLVDIAMGFGSTILGFLIAGFTIFATLTKQQLFFKMYDTIHETSGLRYLKVNFFSFVEVFVIYTFLLVSCLVIKIFAAKGGLIPTTVAWSEKNPLFGYYLNKIALVNFSYILVGALCIYSLLSLKSFIYNTYHVVITSIVWALNSNDADRGS